MSRLRASARAIERELKRAKAGISPRNFEWYPYRSLSCIDQMELVGADDDGLLETLRSLPLLDIGCGDGDLSFVFESMGFSVTALDHELTNYNQMRGVRELKRVLNSSIELHTADLDGRFLIPGGPYGMCLLLGVLYHLKNPFYLLEYLAQKAQYCMLTTRIAQKTPRGTDMEAESVAYLVDSIELNQDVTNFWIFSAASLKRLVTRAGWTICRFESTGCQEGSDPVTNRGDQRACCLLRSRVRLGSRVRLQDGWHDLEEGTYRWTAPKFSLTLAEWTALGAKLRFKFAIPPGSRTWPVTMRGNANGIELPPATYREPGDQIYEAQVPSRAIGAKGIEVRFEIDPPYHAEGDERELGVLVWFWRAGVETGDDNAPIEIVY